MKKKNRQRLKLVILVLWPLTLLLFGAMIMRPSKGFHPSKIKADSSFIKELSQQVLSEKEELFPSHILSQNFFYLASGADCYAFTSEDGAYVLKFFKMNHLKPKYWLNHIPLPWLEDYRLRKVEMRKHRRQEVLASFSAVFEDLKEEAALAYLHLCKERFLYEHISVRDKEGRLFKISLKDTPFILQRRATLIYPYVESLVASGDEAKAVSALVATLALIKKRSCKGYIDLDEGISSNFGFVAGHAVQIDIGRIIKSEGNIEPSQALREVLRVSKKMSLWLRQNHPSLVASFEKEVEKLLQKEDC